MPLRVRPGLRAVVAPCRRCAREWTFPDVVTPTPVADLERVCAVCYEAEVAELKRQVIVLLTPRDHGAQ